MSTFKPLQLSSEARARAAILSEDILAGLRHGRPAEWLEEVIGNALLEIGRLERDRCGGLAEDRAAMWETSVQKYSSGNWPAEALNEARERRKEAIAIADAIRVDTPWTNESNVGKVGSSEEP